MSDYDPFADSFRPGAIVKAAQDKAERTQQFYEARQLAMDEAEKKMAQDTQAARIQRLRDEFAIAALTSLSANQGNPEWVAKTAYAIADAMLAARGMP